jgi:phage portal protein BeeE
MRTFKEIFKSRDRPKDSTEGNRFRAYFGSTTAGKRVSERTALQITAVYACIRVLAESVAQLPLHLYVFSLA